VLGVVPTHHAYLGYARLSHACPRGYARAFATLFVDKIDHNFTLVYFCHYHHRFILLNGCVVLSVVSCLGQGRLWSGVPRRQLVCVRCCLFGCVGCSGT